MPVTITIGQLLSPGRQLVDLAVAMVHCSFIKHGLGIFNVL